MLIEFSVSNFASFKDPVTFSMVGSNYLKEHEGKNEEQDLNIIESGVDKLKLLKSSVIYGANASGKSNLLSAFAFIKKFIKSSSNESQAEDKIPVIKFMLSTESDKEPSSFEIVFLYEQVRYRYGFEVDEDKIHSEWLFSLGINSSSKEILLFKRESQIIKINKRFFKEGIGLEDKTRENALFISVVAQLNGEISNKILKWFKNLGVISGLNDSTLGYTIGKFQKDENFKNKLVNFLKLINLGIEKIEISEIDKPNLEPLREDAPKELKDVYVVLQDLEEKFKRIKEIKNIVVDISVLHKKFDDSDKWINDIALDFSLESEGTRKLIGLLGPIFDTLENGKILIVDELDSRLHTLLTIEIIKLFNSKNSNNKNAQLIFASHDTNLLRKEIFRRDQIWFTEKNDFGSTDLYSLVDYKESQGNKVRNDASFEKDYLIGKYGAIPYFGDINKFFNDFILEEKNEKK